MTAPPSRAVVIGLGASGLAAAGLLRELGTAVTVTDLRTPEELGGALQDLPPGTRTVLGANPPEALDGAGLVVPLKVEAIAQGLTQMLSDPDRLKAMGQAAAASARRRYDIDTVARQMATAYEDILTGRRSPELYWSDMQ